MPTQPPDASGPRPLGMPNDGSPQSVTGSGQSWSSNSISSSSPISSCVDPSRSGTPTPSYKADLPSATPFVPYHYPPVIRYPPNQPFHPSQLSLSSLASPSPTPSPPPYRDFTMSGNSDDDESQGRSGTEEWRNIEDKGERRRVQNRNAQRKHRELLSFHRSGSAYTFSKGRVANSHRRA